MARMTASDMITEIRDAIGSPTETLSDTKLLRFINQTYLNDVCAKYDLPELDESTTITTSSGTADYELSVSNVGRIKEVTDTTNNLQLESISDYQYEQYTQSGTWSGQPVYWLISGVGTNSRMQMTLGPTPAGAYSVSIKYRKYPSELVTSPTATSPIVNQAWDDVIIHGAISRAWRILGDLAKSEYFRKLSLDLGSEAARISIYPSQVMIRPGSMIGRQ